MPNMALRVAVLLVFVLEVNCHVCHRERPLGNGNKMQFNYNFCSDNSGDGLGFIILDDTAGTTKWPQDNLCMAVQDKATYSGREYVVTVQFLNDVGYAGVNSGHPGLVFNMVDSANYDFLFFRPHWPHACYGYGYVVNGNMVYDGGKTGKCPHGAPKGRMWHDTKVHVVGRQSRVYLNNQLLATIPHHFPNIARSGPAILNGFKNRVFFRRFSQKPTC